MFRALMLSAALLAFGCESRNLKVGEQEHALDGGTTPDIGHPVPDIGHPLDGGGGKPLDGGGGGPLDGGGGGPLDGGGGGPLDGGFNFDSGAWPLDGGTGNNDLTWVPYDFAGTDLAPWILDGGTWPDLWPEDLSGP
jgi:hypothetical protein